MNNSIRESLAPRRRLTENEKRSFLAAGGGWTMDGMDGFIYALVLVPALRDLLPKSGIPATSANVGFYGGLLFALFMIGWGTALIWGTGPTSIFDRFDLPAQMVDATLA
jgi:mannose/fructose/N-acetylgalactosamine-specific phosphotransferase system component IID